MLFTSLILLLASCGQSLLPATEIAITPQVATVADNQAFYQTPTRPVPTLSPAPVLKATPISMVPSPTKLVPTPSPEPTVHPTPCPWPTEWGEVPPDTFVPCGQVKEEQSFQEYTVRIYATPGMGAIEILRGGTRIYAQIGTARLKIGHFWVEGPLGEEEMFLPIGQDITADGSPDLLIYDYAGGAYCCMWLDIFEIGSQFRHIGTIVPGDYAPAVADLDADGSLEFTVHDYCFRFYHGGNRRSGSFVAPLIILHYEDGSYRLALDLMRQPAPTLAELTIRAQAFRGDMPPESITELRFWRTVLDLIYSGHADTVEPFFEMVWPDAPEKREEALRTLQDILPRCKYWSELQELNPGWWWPEK
jgi:hypothetical protein